MILRSKKEVTDKVLSMLIKEGIRSGFVPKKRMLAKLGIKQSCHLEVEFNKGKLHK